MLYHKLISIIGFLAYMGLMWKVLTDLFHHPHPIRPAAKVPEPSGCLSCSPGQGCAACPLADTQLGTETPRNTPQNSKEVLP